MLTFAAVAAVCIGGYILLSIQRLIDRIDHQTQVFASAISELKPKPADPEERPADMPFSIWLDIESSRNEWKDEQERADDAARLKSIAEAALAKAHQQTFGRKAAVAHSQAQLDKLVAQETERLAANKARNAKRNESQRASWRAQPYQLWSRGHLGIKDWHCIGGWRLLADAVERMEWFARPESFYPDLQIRSDVGTVLYHYNREDDAKTRAAKWWPV